MFVCVCDEIFKLKGIKMKVLIMYQDAIDVKLGSHDEIVCNTGRKCVMTLEVYFTQVYL